jgi:hypothetical protein
LSDYLSSCSRSRVPLFTEIGLALVFIISLSLRTGSIRNSKSETMISPSYNTVTIRSTHSLAPPKAGPDMTLNRAPSDVPLDVPDEKKGSKRRIRFASTVSTTRVLSRDDFSEDEKTEYWIESGEFDRLQSRARMVVSAVKNHGSAYVDCIEDSYKEAQQLSELMVDDDEIDLFFRDPSCYTNKMEIWAEADYGQRGLEKYISPLQKSQRTSEIRETRLMVVVASKMGVSDDELADLYAALSWMACIYSRMVGHADYTAAYFAKSIPEQPKPVVQMPPLKEETPVQMPALKNETHPESATRNLKLELAQRLTLNTPSQELETLEQTQKWLAPLRDSRRSRKKKRLRITTKICVCRATPRRGTMGPPTHIKPRRHGFP